MDIRSPSKDILELLEKAPDTEVVDILVPDINGVIRGKQLPIKNLQKIYDSGFNFPAASVLADTKGEAADTVPYGTKDGDPDKLCFPIPGTLQPVSWASRPTAQVLTSMQEVNGEPFFADSRQVLLKALEPLNDMGLTPVVALEFEFSLLNTQKMPPEPAKPPVHFPELTGAQTYNFDPLYDFQNFIHEVEQSCRDQGVPVSGMLAEFGEGQFEINLNHGDDIATACDNGLLLKRTVKGVARRHGLLASFMAKPFSGEVGNGLHIHLSILDRDGANIFAGRDPSSPYTDQFRYSVGGLLTSMAESMAIFAPNANSYRRLQPGFYVPVDSNWGHNHRGVSIRVPVSKAEDTRLEHRVSSADANPYLVCGAILSGIHHGLMHQIDPGPMIKENTDIDEKITLPIRWDRALEAFHSSAILPKYLGEEFCQAFWALRAYEEREFHSEISDRDYDWYLRTV